MRDIFSLGWCCWGPSGAGATAEQQHLCRVSPPQASAGTESSWAGTDCSQVPEVCVSADEGAGLHSGRCQGQGSGVRVAHSSCCCCWLPSVGVLLAGYALN